MPEERMPPGRRRSWPSSVRRPRRFPDQSASRLRRWWARAVGSDVAIRRMEAVEDRQAAEYDALTLQALGTDADAQQILREIAVEERAHAKACFAMAPQLGPQGATVLDTLLRRRRWHGRGGGWVADAIYGVNDGLARSSASSAASPAPPPRSRSISSATSSSSPASPGCSPRLSWAPAHIWPSKASAKSTKPRSSAKKEIAENPEEEKEEMALFYQLQGFSVEESERMAEKLAEDPQQMVRAMAQNELGLSEEHQLQPWRQQLQRCPLHGHRRLRPHHPLLLHGRHRRGGLGVHHQPRRPLRRRRRRVP